MIRYKEMSEKQPTSKEKLCKTFRKAAQELQDSWDHGSSKPFVRMLSRTKQENNKDWKMFLTLFSWLCQKLLLCFHISVQTLKSTQRKVSFILLGVQTSNNKQQTCKTFNQRLLLKGWATLHQTKTNTSIGWKELEQMHRLVQTPGPYPAVTSADVCS